MSTAADSGLASRISMSSLRRRALSLGAVNAFDYAMQFLLPVVLARCLDPAEFGQYRLMWLVVTTVMLVAPLSLPQGLYYFLPRSAAREKRLYVHQTVLYLAFAGLASAWLVSPWNGFLPAGVASLAEFGPLMPTFVLLTCVSYLLDVLPTVDERLKLQAGFTLSMSMVRAVVLSAGAYLTGDIHVLVALLVLLVALKLALLLGYIGRFHGLRGRWFEWPSFRAQFAHAAPFGVSSAMFGLRGQADQWVTASLFSLHSFAAFSIAAVLGPMVNLLRQSVNHTFLPSMSRLHAAQDTRSMLKLNSQANAMVATVVYPVLAFSFVFAEEMVTLVYTSAYVDAAPVMRIYIVGLTAVVVELVSIMMLFHGGAFAFRLGIAVLLCSVPASWLCAQHFGLPGAAMGSVAAVFIDRLATLHYISRRSGIALMELQEWRLLAKLLLAAALAGTMAWMVDGLWLAQAAPVLRMAAGAAVLAASYFCLLRMGMGPKAGDKLSIAMEGPRA